jgi:hypothetical protein
MREIVARQQQQQQQQAAGSGSQMRALIELIQVGGCGLEGSALKPRGVLEMRVHSFVQLEVYGLGF